MNIDKDLENIDKAFEFLMSGEKMPCRRHSHKEGEDESKWIVNSFGEPDRIEFEISIVRTGNCHGRDSYGWFDENKILISHSTLPFQYCLSPMVWNKLIKTAQEIADELNMFYQKHSIENGG